MRQTPRPADLPLEWTCPPAIRRRRGESPCRLVLWDLHGALADWWGFDAAAHVQAFTCVVGRTPHRTVRVGGRPDPLVALDMLEMNGVPAGSARLLLPSYLPAFARALRALFAQRRARRPGAVGGTSQALFDALHRLSMRRGILQSFVASEIRPSIRLKLGITGLSCYLDPELGACGSDHVDRDALCRIALLRAESQLGPVFDTSGVVVLSGARLRYPQSSSSAVPLRQMHDAAAPALGPQFATMGAHRSGDFVQT